MLSLRVGRIYDNLIIMKSYISATQAARTFSDLVNRVYYRGEEFIIERGGTPVCQLVPVRPPPCTVAALVQLLRRVPTPDAEYWQTVEALTRQQPPLPSAPWPC
jgi:antitoxin (DNA-binding transcriptional repressor) of toxin-antitoxin stability system